LDIGLVEGTAVGMAVGDSGRKLGVATGNFDGVNTGDFDGEVVVEGVGALDGLKTGLAEGALKPVGD
jgi:sorbitol-specific phosphotransferase system component IIA